MRRNKDTRIVFSIITYLMTYQIDPNCSSSLNAAFQYEFLEFYC